MRKTIIIVLGLFLLIAVAVIAFLLLDRQNQQQNFTQLQNDFMETKLELDRLKEVLSQSENDMSITVYYPKSPDSDEDPTIVFPIVREVNTGDKLTAIVTEYVTGLSDDEVEEGYYLPSGDYELTNNQRLDLRGESNCGGKNFTATITNKTATVQFCKTLYGVGTMADAKVKTSIQRSIEKLDGIEKVVILTNEGNCLFDESGLNTCLDV